MRNVLALLVLALGCTEPNTAASVDQAGLHDQQFAEDDQAIGDFASPPDLDQGEPSDAASSPDHAVADLASAPDLRSLADLAQLADANTPPDLSVDLLGPPDLLQPIDLSKLDADKCANVTCGMNQACCPCTGMCYATACLACCMFCL